MIKLLLIKYRHRKEVHKRWKQEDCRVALQHCKDKIRRSKAKQELNLVRATRKGFYEYKTANERLGKM